MRMMTMGLALGLAAAATETRAQLAEMRTSDERGAVRCPRSFIVGRLRCEGGWCDNVFITCAGRVYQQQGTRFNTRWVENAGHKTAECARPRRGPGPDEEALRGVMAGIGCSGDNCDNIQLECANMRGLRPDLDRCLTIRRFSEESGGGAVNDIAVPEGYGVVSITCGGRHCDDKTVRMCPIIDG